MPNLQNLAAAWDVGTQYLPIIVDLLKTSNLLQTATVRKASHGIKHRYRIFNNLPEAAFREIGVGIIPQKINLNTAQIDLKELVFDLFDDYKVVEEYPEGKRGYFRDASPVALATMAQSLVRAIFYGNLPTVGMPGAFKGLRQYAIDMDQQINKGGGNGASTSIYAVRWDELDGASIRVNNTPLMEIKDLTPNQPVPQVTNTGNNTQLDIYKWKFTSYFTLVLPSVKSVAVLRGLDAGHKPTVDDMNRLLNMVKAPSGRVFLYANDTAERMVSELKNTKLSLYTFDSSYDDSVSAWRGIPILTENNIVDTEPNA